ncbi:MAG: DNA/RNA nuclease SfsA [Proteobacteria bacterium]|nr:DNA/RNA nuclease SfsA [Pseudomonadota bacterium]
MQFETPLTLGTFIRRYKRFLADVELEDRTVITAHVPNTGSLRSTSDPGSRVALSYHPDPGRKLKWTLELIEVAGDHWVGLNTARPNRIVEEAIANKRIGPLRGYDTMRREVRYGRNSRIDILLEKGESRCYVEVKNVTYKEGRRALFPDAVTARGTKHLLELREMVRQGHRGVAFFLVNRGDCVSMGPANEIDPKYSRTLREVTEQGVEMLAYRTAISLNEIEIERKLRIILNK